MSTGVTNLGGGAVSGSVSQAGLKNGGRISFVSLNTTTWTALPPTALPLRNAISIQNRSSQTIWLAYTPNPTAWIILPTNGERAYDITDAIPIYALATVAGTCVVTIEELS